MRYQKYNFWRALRLRKKSTLCKWRYGDNSLHMYPQVAHVFIKKCIVRYTSIKTVSPFWKELSFCSARFQMNKNFVHCFGVVVTNRKFRINIQNVILIALKSKHNLYWLHGIIIAETNLCFERDITTQSTPMRKIYSALLSRHCTFLTAYIARKLNKTYSYKILWTVLKILHFKWTKTLQKGIVVWCIWQYIENAKATQRIAKNGTE